LLMLAGHAAAALAQEGAAPAGEAPAGGGLMSLQINLMFWTLFIFVILFLLLTKFAYPAIIGAVEKREKSLQEALDRARQDREEAARVLAEHRKQIESARGEAQALIADGRATAERMRQDLLEQARQEQQAMLERARHEIETEKDRAIAQLRREAVDLAIAGATRVVEENLDSERNRQLVENYLASLGTQGGAGSVR
ncbi:MAG TPA: F0F1 ATP synthase subunit B, partial [Gemmatimonadaceae bacterium]|nr:F0F1 ATP synthase subunit B [Gemmatimonadaceae bacterium]